MISDDLIKFINDQTGVVHGNFDEIPKEDLKGSLFILVNSVLYNEKEKFIKRIQTENGSWYADEISYLEYCQWMLVNQFEIIKAAQDISKYSEGIDVESLIKKAQDEIDSEAALKAVEEETQKLPEDELISEDEFEKMWGE